MKQISIVTTTYNCLDQIACYYRSVKQLDQSLFDWVVVDGLSTDGTSQFLSERVTSFSYFVSESDHGCYFGLNKAIAHVRTPYYMVLGADDRPSAGMLHSLLRYVDNRPALVLGAVNIVPDGKIKRPGPRWLHRFVWGRCISHHSVGTLIRTNVHQRFGSYDTKYTIVADGNLIKQILQSDEKIVRIPDILGDYYSNGISGRNTLQSIFESYILQVAAGSNSVMQLLFLMMRLLKSSILASWKR